MSTGPISRAEAYDIFEETLEAQIRKWRDENASWLVMRGIYSQEEIEQIVSRCREEERQRFAATVFDSVYVSSNGRPLQ
jgi:hypothetical protein